MVVKAIRNAEEFRTLNSPTATLVIDFYATWCGPCKQISPFFEKLSDKQEYSGTTFAKVDVDACSDVSRPLGVSAMPTFMFFKNGQKVDEIKGADPHGLASKVQQHCTASASESSSEIKQTGRVKGMSDLNDKIELRQLEMLNGSDDSDIRSLLGNKKAGITSDTDEQLMLFVPFQESVRLHSIQLQVDKDAPDHAPASLSIWINTPNILSFDDVSNIPATQVVQEITYDEEGSCLIGLRFVKFQRVNTLVLFVASNKGGVDETKLTGLRFVGEPIQGVSNGGIVKKMGDEE